MKKFATLLFIALFVPAVGQNSLLYGIKGNPLSLLQNPGAQTDLRFHAFLGTVGNFNAQLERPLGEYWGDLSAQWDNFTNPSEHISLQADWEVSSIGWQYKKSYVYAGIRHQTDFLGSVDNDLMRFAFHGMRDSNGVIDPHFSGDFSNTSLIVQDRIIRYVGWQKKLSPKLTFGGTIEATNHVFDFRLKMNAFQVNSVLQPDGTNTLNIGVHGEAQLHGLSLLEVPLDSLINGSYPLLQYFKDYRGLLWKGETRFLSTSFGATYQVSPTLKITGAITGLGKRVSSTKNNVSMQVNTDLIYSGFQYNSGDTASLKGFYAQLREDLKESITWTEGSAMQTLPFQTTHLGCYYNPYSKHALGINLLRVQRASANYASLSLEYHGFWTRNIQFSTSYQWNHGFTLPMSNQLSFQLQTRLLPMTQIYLGSSSALMLPGPDALIPSNLDRLNVYGGIQLILFDTHWKQAHQKKKAERKSKRSARSSEK